MYKYSLHLLQNFKGSLLGANYVIWSFILCSDIFSGHAFGLSHKHLTVMRLSVSVCLSNLSLIILLRDKSMLKDVYVPINKLRIGSKRAAYDTLLQFCALSQKHALKIWKLEKSWQMEPTSVADLKTAFECSKYCSVTAINCRNWHQLRKFTV